MGGRVGRQVREENNVQVLDPENGYMIKYDQYLGRRARRARLNLRNRVTL